MEQIPLPLRLPKGPGLDAYVAADREVLDSLREWGRGSGQRQLFLHGESGTGKTHLLHGACQAAAASGRRVLCVPLGYPDLAPAVLDDLERLDAIAIDDIHLVAGDADWERALFDLYNRLVDAGRCLLCAARMPPIALGLRLVDLTSRLSAGAAYALQPLDDAGRSELLCRLVGERGLKMEPRIVDYILSRCPRAPAALVDLMDALDQASLVKQRPITVKLVAEVLSASAPDASAPV
jgi:DnaA family protein